jgi:hypothetical protein
MRRHSGQQENHGGCTMFKNLAVFVAALLCSMQAQGTPVEFTFAATITNNSGIVGVSVGDIVTIDLLANNGSSGLNSQSWTIGNFISASLSAGSYSQSYVDGFGTASLVAFTTDAFGNLTQSNFPDTTLSADSTDTFGMGGQIRLFSNDFQDFFGRTAVMSNGLTHLTAWSVNEQSQAPEPGTLSLLGLGLAGAVLLRRRCSTQRSHRYWPERATTRLDTDLHRYVL